jgi:hypothetical protein
MNKARLIITAINVEKISQDEAARRYGVSQSWVSKLFTRYKQEGEAAFTPKTKRPHNITTHPTTIWRYLKKNGAITPQPQKRPRSSYIRFQADLPNETWQSDFTHYRLATGEDTEIITWLDDHSRYALHVSCHHRITARIVLNTFQKPHKHTANQPQPSPTTEWSSPQNSPPADADSTATTPSKHTSPNKESAKKTPPPATPQPAAKSKDSNKP